MRITCLPVDRFHRIAHHSIADGMLSPPSFGPDAIRSTGAPLTIGISADDVTVRPGGGHFRANYRPNGSSNHHEPKRTSVERCQSYRLITRLLLKGHPEASGIPSDDAVPFDCQWQSMQIGRSQKVNQSRRSMSWWCSRVDDCAHPEKRGSRPPPLAGAESIPPIAEQPDANRWLICLLWEKLLMRFEIVIE